MPRLLAAALALSSLITLGANASPCARGTAIVANDPIVAIAVSPNDDDIYVALRIERPQLLPQYIVELRRPDEGFARQLYSSDWPIVKMRADDDAVYLVTGFEAADVVRVPRDGEPPITLLSKSVALGAAMEIDDSFVYAVTETLGIVRVPKGGGSAEIIVNASRFPEAALAVDRGGVYYTTGGTAYRYDKASGTTLQTNDLSNLSMLVVEGPWLYEASSREIVRIPAQGGDVQSVARADFDESIAGIAASGSQVAALIGHSVPRGCANATLVLFPAPGSAPVTLSNRGGALARSAEGFVHAPRDCFLIGDHPPFTVERFCTTPGRRRAVTTAAP